MNSIMFLVLGLLIGSFLNVCIYRIPKKEDIVYTPSHCMYCGWKIKWYDLIPVISYILLGGKCRNCKKKISIQYPIIELSNGAAYLGIYYMFGNSIQTILYCSLFSALLVISIIDFRHYIIPNGIVIFIIILGIIQICFDINNWIKYLIGFFIVSSFLFILAILTKGKLGGGDIKLMAAAGLLIGWEKIILALFIGSILGSIVGIILLITKVIKRNQLIPFGPFLSVGIIIAAVFGEKLLNWYISLLLI